jgi:hypothetical protein
MRGVSARSESSAKSHPKWRRWCCPSASVVRVGVRDCPPDPPTTRGRTTNAARACEATYLLWQDIAVIAGPSACVVAAVVELRVRKAGHPRASLKQRPRAVEACDLLDGYSSIAVIVNMCAKSQKQAGVVGGSSCRVSRRVGSEGTYPGNAPGPHPRATKPYEDVNEHGRMPRVACAVELRVWATVLAVEGSRSGAAKGGVFRREQPRRR